jgi:hypothetical protein
MTRGPPIRGTSIIDQRSAERNSGPATSVGFALGAQAGEARMRAVVTGAGFTRFRRAHAVQSVYEARP